MSQTYKIDEDIPLPPEEEDEEIEEIEPPEIEDPRWVPFKPNKRKCRNDKHYPAIGRCLACGDVFPCPSGKCGHVDCADPSIAGLDCEGNGTPIPEWINVVDKEAAIVSRAEGTLTISVDEDELEGVFNGQD